MNEKLRGGGEISKDSLREKYEEARRALDQARIEYYQVIDGLKDTGVAKTLRDSTAKMEQAERAAFDALEAWAKVALHGVENE